MEEEEGKTVTEAKYQTQMMPVTLHDHTKVKAKTFSNVADTFHVTPLKKLKGNIRIRRVQSKCQ